jgi:hypothetical protein
VLLALWCAAIGAKSLAAYRLFRNGAARLMPGLWVFLVAGICRSLLLLLLEGSPQYRTVYVASVPFLLVAEGFAVTSIFWRMVEHYPRFRTAGSIFLSAFCLLGAALGLLVRLVGDGPYRPIIQASLLFQSYGAMAMLVVLGGARLFLPRDEALPIRRSAQDAADVMAFSLVMNMATSVFAVKWGLEYGGVARLLPLIGGIATSCLWAFTVNPQTDPVAQPRYATKEEYRAAQYSTLRMLAKLRRATRALRG